MHSELEKMCRLFVNNLKKTPCGLLCGDSYYYLDLFRCLHCLPFPLGPGGFSTPVCSFLFGDSLVQPQVVYHLNTNANILYSCSKATPRLQLLQSLGSPIYLLPTYSGLPIPEVTNQ